jgi:hypothetical protein
MAPRKEVVNDLKWGAGLGRFASWLRPGFRCAFRKGAKLNA